MIDKENNTFLDLNYKYNNNIYFFRFKGNTYLEWDICFDENFSRFIVYSSIDKKDCVYLTSNLKVEFETTNNLLNRYQINFENYNVKYFRLATVFKNNIVCYSNILEVNRG